MRKLFFAVVVFGIVIFGWYKHALTAVDSGSDARVSITIPSGSSVTSIGALLAEKNLIRSPRVLGLYARFHSLESSLKAGSYILEPSMSTPEVLAALMSGKSQEEKVTIPEGYTVKDIDELLSSKGISESGAILGCARTCDFSSFTFLPKTDPHALNKLEGYLYPDTYYVQTTEFVPKFFLERLLTTFKHRVVEDLSKDLDSSKRSLGDIVTMASLLEEETKTQKERPIVAGILWKRFDAKMGLGVDAAIRYGLNKTNEALTESDLASDSPYNLRRLRGLPPSPISNPSLKSIEAALHPEESEYWYYLHDHNGEIHYAVTNDEQNTNRYQYLR